jgi:hypothetical protein
VGCFAEETAGNATEKTSAKNVAKERKEEMCFIVSNSIGKSRCPGVVGELFDAFLLTLFIIEKRRDILDLQAVNMPVSAAAP